MEKIRLGEIADVTRGYLISGDPMHYVTSVTTDSRAAKAGDLFIPLIGENHDAHDFVRGALDNGCSYDAPGSFATWLSGKVDMHAWLMPGKRHDIGDMKSYEAVRDSYAGPKICNG